MTYEEAHNYLEDMQREYTRNRALYPKELITANGIAIETLEKQIPKHIDIVAGYDLCPRCGFNYGEDVIRRRLHSWCKPFCERCGQAIDWRDAK